MMAVDLWTIERLYWMFMPPAKVIYAGDPIIEALKTRAPARARDRLAGATDSGARRFLGWRCAHDPPDTPDARISRQPAWPLQRSARDELRR